MSEKPEGPPYLEITYLTIQTTLIGAKLLGYAVSWVVILSPTFIYGWLLLLGAYLHVRESRKEYEECRVILQNIDSRNGDIPEDMYEIMMEALHEEDS